MRHAVTDATAADHEGREQLMGEPLAVPDAGPSKAPSVSVLMPTYNNPGRYVPGAIESILKQMHSDFEFLITDAGLTGGSLEVMRRYAELNPRICLTIRPTMGIADALNEMVGMARARQVCAAQRCWSSVR
jgi:cellulose synthase/poly-beta-1,6-N-acetylglucosamine synthase-like glycosyltransferase